jgi:hypothetical protein
MARRRLQYWKVPLLSTGDQGHFCVVAFVHSVDDPMTETGMGVDTITPRNRLIAQKNLHIGAPLSPRPAVEGRPMREYIEFHNPVPHEAVYDLVFDMRGLPTELVARLQFTQLRTVEPLERSIHGIAATRAGGQPLRTIEVPQARRVIHLPEFVPRIYEAHSSARVIVPGIRLAAMGNAACHLTITNTGRLVPGSEYRFTVRQIDEKGSHGGSLYVVRIAGQLPLKHSFVAPSHDLNLRVRQEIKDLDPTSLPPWIRYQINTERRNEANKIVNPNMASNGEGPPALGKPATARKKKRKRGKTKGKQKRQREKPR